VIGGLLYTVGYLNIKRYQEKRKMDTVKAIVMTCDKYRALTDHMIFKYEKLWPNHPFHFRVAYQESVPRIPTDRIEYMKSSPDIKTTVLTLLNDLDDEELIYWCIDDKYPVKINVPRIEKMYQWLANEKTSAVSGILFCRCRRMWDNTHLTGETIVDNQQNVYLERKGYAQIWIHQFLRVKVLRYLFKSFPDTILFARSMDELIKHLVKPPSHRIFVSRQNLVVFGESTDAGILTRNCYRSILENNLSLPQWCSETTKRKIVIGNYGANNKRRLRYLIRGLRHLIKRLMRRSA